MGKRQNYRALLVDIDGTLTHAGRRVPDGATLGALEELRRRGVAVVLATGRTLAAARPQVIGGFRPDYYVCTNGAYVTAGDGEILYHHPMDAAQFEAVLALAEGEGCSVGFSYPEGYYVYLADGLYRSYYREVNGDMDILRDGSDRTRHLEGLPYGAFGILTPQRRAAFDAEGLGLHLTPFDDGVYDINQMGHTKASGAARLLEATGICWEELVAVGDGENDMELLSAAGLGVAMGNASERVKACADAVTASVRESGVLRVIEEYF